VDGGYTPLRWKYLGDELRARLANPADSTAGWDLMKRGAIAQHGGDTAAADAAFTEAGDRLGGSAAPAFARALLAAASGNRHAARGQFQRAISRDATYRTPYTGDGFPALWDGDRGAAEAAFEAVLALDDQDPFASLGMALAALMRRDWDAVTRWLAPAMADPRCEVDARRALGRAYRAQGRLPEAIAEFERSLLLALKGQTPIARPIVTHLAASRLPDPDHAAVHAWLAECHASLGDLDRAISGYQIAIVGGRSGPLAYARLAWWSFSNGNWGAAVVAAVKSVAALLGWRAGYAERSASIASRAAASMENRLG
jgi:tetratricopeptide (TPR) repeat protein